MNELSVEEIVARLEDQLLSARPWYPSPNDVRALIADWRKRGEALEDVKKYAEIWERLKAHPAFGDIAKRAALTPQQQPPSEE